MKDRQSIIRSLQKYNNGARVITAAEFARFLGISDRHAKRKLAGLPTFENKYYFVPDVADMILKAMS